MKHREILVVALLLAVGGCQAREGFRPNADHCTNNGGDSYCAERFPGLPLCNSGEGECSIGDRFGCVEEVAEQCHAPCGEPGDLSCVEGEDSGTTTTTGSSGSETGSSGSETGSSSTTGEIPCVGDGDCMDAEAPFCDPVGECVGCDGMSDPDGACAGVDTGMPVCDAGVCVACTGEQVGACEGETPVCGEGNVCTACTEHAQCPESACHLDGAEVGGCFDAADVVMVADAGELAAALAGLEAMEQAVLVLASGTYGTTIGLANDVEVAFLSTGGAELSGSGAFDSVTISSNAIVYFGGVTIAGNSNASGIACSGTSVWLDDSEVRNNAQVGLDVSGGCAAHLRRSVVASNSGGGIVLNGASFRVQNSSISSNSGLNPGVQIVNSTFESAYTTLVGNTASGGTPDTMQCTNAMGFVRNSIVVGEAVPSISGCEGGGIVWESNSVDTDGLGGTNTNSKGPWNPAWFVSPGTNDYHLTTAGETVFMGIASWQPGDPLTDIDGDAIPTDGPSFPGYDQP